MKQFLVSLFFIGWFFNVQIPHGQVAGVVVDTSVGTFESREACSADRQEMLEFLNAMGVPYKISPFCIQKEGA